ncbi:MAG: phenylalanine--tRNA ligase subunit alpha [Pseudomonadota bacterium]
MDDLAVLHSELTENINAASDLQSLESVRVAALGKQGSISLLLKGLGKLAPDQRKQQGQALNNLRESITQSLDTKRKQLEAAALEVRLAQEKVDVTLEARPATVGSIHPFTQALYEIVTIFKEMGFSVAEGPDIEDDEHNFTALNIAPEHPARQEADTFYLPPREDGMSVVLRTHTSPVQIRTLRKTKPPVWIIAPGRTYRSDSDPTHTPNFHQVEGLLIDEGIHMGHLKGCLVEFCRRFFGVDDLPARFRPAFFPFTEPSAEMDIGCSRKGGEFKIGAGDDWLEILGCGMVHPNVLENCGIDSSQHQGFAFGTGIERMAMLKYGIPDLRAFYESDNRWLHHYGFSVVNALSGDTI